MAEVRQVCTFFLEDLFFGVEVEKVQEVKSFQGIPLLTPVPLAPSVVMGLINLRGQIVTAIDLRQRLELSERPPDQIPMNVVLRSTDEGTVSLLVDEIDDVLEVDEDTFERPPETLKGKVRELIRGVYKLEERLLLFLDTERVIDLSRAQ